MFRRQSRRMSRRAQTLSQSHDMTLTPYRGLRHRGRRRSKIRDAEGEKRPWSKPLGDTVFKPASVECHKPHPSFSRLENTLTTTHTRMPRTVKNRRDKELMQCFRPDKAFGILTIVFAFHFGGTRRSRKRSGRVCRRGGGRGRGPGTTPVVLNMFVLKD